MISTGFFASINVFSCVSSSIVQGFPLVIVLYSSTCAFVCAVVLEMHTEATIALQMAFKVSEKQLLGAVERGTLK
jgi:hypothetical protein